MTVVTELPPGEVMPDAVGFKSVPRETTEFLVEQARIDLAEYNDSAPEVRPIVKAKMRELIEELDNALHQANMQDSDQRLILDLGELVGHQVRWRIKKRHVWN